MEPLAEGLDHVVHHAPGGLLVRTGKEPDPELRARLVRAEAQLLERLRALAPPAVPAPVEVDEAAGRLTYRKVPGTPLLALRGELRRLDPVRFGAVLGAFLTRLHRVPLADVQDLVPAEPEALREWRTAAREDFAQVADAVPAALHPAVEAFLAAPDPPSAPALVPCHADLGIEHVLVDAATMEVVGVIDWGDAAITDPAVDLGRLLRDLGEPALAAVLDAYAGADEPRAALVERARCYARCGVFEELRYGLGPGGPVYEAQARAAISRLFGR